MDCLGVCRVRLDRECLSAAAFNRFDYGRGCVSILGVGDGDTRSIRGEAFGDRGPNTTRATGDQSDLTLQFLGHCVSPLLRRGTGNGMQRWPDGSKLCKLRSHAFEA